MDPTKKSISRLLVAAFLSFASFVSGCGGVALPTLQASDYRSAGPAPTEAELQEFVLHYIDRNFKDPDVKQLRIKKPTIVHLVVQGRGPIKVWHVCFEANAKNSYGGYTGVEFSQFIIDNGSITVYPGTNSLIERCFDSYGWL